MIIAECKLESTTPYSQSRPVMVEKKDNESNDDLEKRTWRERVHEDSNTGTIVIPPMAFKNCIDSVAKYRGEKIKGKGSKTYTQKFASGVMVYRGIDLGVKKNDVEGEWFFMSAKGIKGPKCGTRVWRCYPVFRKWSGALQFYISDPDITREVFEAYVRSAGEFIGIGRFRPEVSGFYGKFKLSDFKWTEQ